jgi:hypothetical protein
MNESLLIAQIVTINERGYALFVPYGAPYSEIYEALEQMLKENKAKQADAIAAEEKKKLDEEMKNGLLEATT